MKFNRIQNDPIIKVAENELQEKLKNERVAQKEENRVQQAKQAEKDRIRNETLRGRLKKRGDSPEDYSAYNSEQLNWASGDHRKEPYCANLDLSGDVAQPIIIRGDYANYNFSGSTFRHVRFFDGDFNGCDFTNCTFENVVFGHKSTLNSCDFSNSDFKEVTFVDCLLEMAKMVECKFQVVEFKRQCQYRNVNFESSIFHEKVLIDFDRNRIQSIQFSTRRTDSWYKLTFPYSGISPFINVLLCGLYFGSLLVKLYAFKAIVYMHDTAPPGQLKELLIDFNGMNAFKFLFGESKLSIAVAIAVLIYQALRYYLTVNLSPLIDDVRYGGKTPALESYEKFIGIQSGVQMLGYTAVALFITDVAVLLTLSIK